jgi:hypothetical protein
VEIQPTQNSEVLALQQNLTFLHPIPLALKITVEREILLQNPIIPTRAMRRTALGSFLILLTQAVALLACQFLIVGYPAIKN